MVSLPDLRALALASHTENFAATLLQAPVALWFGRGRSASRSMPGAALVMTTAEAGGERPLLPALSPVPPGLTSHMNDRD